MYLENKVRSGKNHSCKIVDVDALPFVLDGCQWEYYAAEGRCGTTHIEEALKAVNMKDACIMETQQRQRHRRNVSSCHET